MIVKMMRVMMVMMMMVVMMMMMMMRLTIAGDGWWMDGWADGWMDGWEGEKGSIMWMWVAVSSWSVGWTEVTAVLYRYRTVLEYSYSGQAAGGKVMVGRLGSWRLGCADCGYR